jgi:hypothetical protein
MPHNAPQAAAVRVLADFIFAFCFHFISHNQLSFPTNPALRLPTRYASFFYSFIPKSTHVDLFVIFEKNLIG